MNTPFRFSITLLMMFVALQLCAQTRNTVANGGFFDPATWDCNCIPSPSDNIAIHHQLTIDNDFIDITGTFIVETGASLTQSNSQIVGVQTGGTFNNQGTVTLTTIASFGFVENHGFMHLNNLADNSALFLNTGILNATSVVASNSGILENAGILNAPTVSIAGGIINNKAQINCDLFSDHYSTGYNLGIINVTGDFTNTGTYENEPTGIIIIGGMFLHSDSANVNNIFTNDGVVGCYDWTVYAAALDGSGQFCVQNMSTLSFGAMNGTLDFCDATGGSIDFNLFGTLGPGVTTCANPCTVGLQGQTVEVGVRVAPNPMHTQTIFTIEGIAVRPTLYLFDALGKQVVPMLAITSNNQMVLQRNNLPAGLYFYQLLVGGQVIQTGKVVME